MKYLILASLVAFAASGSAWATESTMTVIVSIDKTVCPDDDTAMDMCEVRIANAVESLDKEAPNHTGTCWAKAEVTEYIPYDPEEIPYFGIALVDLTYSCESEGQKYLDEVKANPFYTIWSNSRVDPFPGISGSN